MSGFIWTCLAFFGGLVLAAVGDLFSEEIRNRLDKLPFSILRAASNRLPYDVRSAVYEEEWLPELYFILRGSDALPVTRLIKGTRFALGLLRSAPLVANDLRGIRDANPIASADDAALMAEWNPTLTFRELQILSVVSAGLTADAAANRLGGTPHGLRRQLRAICDELGVATPIEAVAWAIERKII